MSKYKINFNIINQWGPFFTFITKTEYNWIDFSPIWTNLEYGKYKGHYFELVFVLLGIGFYFEIYDVKEREDFVNPLLEMIDNFHEKENNVPVD